MRRCAIIGHRGQDGRLLEENLRRAGHSVTGVGRGDFDLLSRDAVRTFLAKNQPEEIYYLAAYHHSSEDRIEMDDAELFRLSFDTHVHGLISFLEGLRQSASGAHLFYAASSHVFGQPEESPQTERTAFRPQNIYGISKAAGVEACRFYRQQHGVAAATGFLYNHESPFRSQKFVSQKIVQKAVQIARGEANKLVLGDLSAMIDWGYAPDFVDAMTRIVRLPEAGDFVVATGELHSVGEFVQIAFDQVGLDWRQHVEENPSVIKRRTAPFLGDATKLRRLTGWSPTVNFAKLVEILIKSAIETKTT